MSETTKDSKGFTKEEKAAMKERAKELKAQANQAEAESAVLEKIAEMSEPERSMVRRIHDLVKENAPSLSPKTWYGMPGYARDGKIVCFYQGAEKFGTRYGTFGFTDEANLDEGTMWPASFAIKELSAADEAKLVALVKKAVS